MQGFFCFFWGHAAQIDAGDHDIVENQTVVRTNAGEKPDTDNDADQKNHSNSAYRNQSRGQKRAVYYLENGAEVDRYGVVLEALKKDPPLKTIGIMEIYERAKAVLDKEKEMPKLKSQMIKSTMNAMFEILEESGYEADRVFDWKENMLTFREPLFLFYLRWRRDE